MIDTPEQLLDALQQDPAVMALVGLYRFGDGGTAPAVAILGSNEFVDGLEDVDGLEVIVNRAPRATSRPVYDGCVLTEKAWVVHLIQYAQGNTAMEVADLLAARYPGTTYASLGAGTMPQIAGIEQLAVTIPANVNA